MGVSKLTLSLSEGIDQYTLTNTGKTLSVVVLNDGGKITHILTPDKTGQIRDVVLGFDQYEQYKHPRNPYFGALIGRYANRIGQGTFTIGDQTFHLLKNNGPNALHGGSQGFDKKVWHVTVVSESPPSISLQLTSSDGEEGYPGTLTTTVTYTVTDTNELVITYHAVTNKDTIVNLTNHTYFNLGGVSLTPTVHHTQVTMTDNVKGVLALDAHALPTGKTLTWKDAPWMDFTGANAGTTIGKRFDQLSATKGYDHPYVLHTQYMTDTSVLPLQHALSAYAPESGIELAFSTTEPCFQFYTGNFIADDVFQAKRGQGSIPIGPHAGFCLESQRYPDAPNKSAWRSSVLLTPGQTYGSKTVFAFKLRS